MFTTFVGYRICLLGLLGLAMSACSGADDNGEIVGTESSELRQGMADVMKLAHNAGIPCSDKLVVAGAIAAAESSLNTRGTHSNGPTSGCSSGSIDRGLWQINSCYHPEISATCAFDGACNARALVAISHRGADYSPWSTFNGGDFEVHLQAARAAYPSVCGGGSPSPSPGSGSCSVQSDRRLHCLNTSGAAIRASTKASAEVVDHLRTSPSWFDCWETGELHAGGNKTWYHTQGDDDGAFGFVPAVNLESTSTMDANPTAIGLRHCS